MCSLLNRYVFFSAESGDRFSQSSKVTRFRLTDDCWLQSGSVRMQVTLNNKGTDPHLTPVAHPLCMFSSARLFVGGQVAETIESVEVLGTLLDFFKPSARRATDSMENHPFKADGTRLELLKDKSRRLIFELPVGLLKQ